LFKDPDIAKQVLEVFLNLNAQMDRTIITVQPQCSAEELKAFKRAVGCIMYEVFDKAVEPICKAYPALKPDEFKD
jgi:hypothetical protein